jgi:hypothetical protein
MITKMQAILSLVSDAQVVIRGGIVEWVVEPSNKPTDSEIEQEQARLNAVYESKNYQRQRETEYPPITDYIDGVVKGDQAQIDAYIAACQAVKAKYPKGA